MRQIQPLASHLSIALCNIVWACDYPLYNLVLGRYISPLAMVAASLVAAAVWSLVPLLWERPEPIERKDMTKIFVAAMLIGILRKLCMMEGLVRTSPVDGSIIGTLTPLFVLVLSVAVGLEGLSRRKVVGLALGMAGAIGVILSSSSAAHERSDTTGNLLVLGAAGVSALYMVWFKGLVSKYRVTTLLRWIYCLSAVVMLPLGAHDIYTTDFSAMSRGIVAATLFVLLVPTYLPNLLLNYSLRFVEPTTTSIYAYLQPVVAIALSVAMGLDRLHIDTVLFAVVIFVGVMLVSTAQRRTQPNT